MSLPGGDGDAARQALFQSCGRLLGFGSGRHDDHARPPSRQHRGHQTRDCVGPRRRGYEVVRSQMPAGRGRLAHSWQGRRHARCGHIGEVGKRGSSRQIRWRAPGRDRTDGRNVVLGHPPNRDEHPLVEDSGLARSGGDRFQPVEIGRLFDVDDEPPDSPPGQWNPDLVADVEIEVTGRVSKTSIDRVRRDVRNDPDDAIQSAAADRRNSSASSIDSQGNSSRPKCP